MTRIDSFTGKYAFLSNFHPSTVRLGGLSAPTVEHAFQAAKAARFSDRLDVIGAATPGAAKRLGRRVQLRDDWEDIKLWVMEDLLRQKFARADARIQLLETGDATLVEGNTWGDTFWGDCDGDWAFPKPGNRLGVLLMLIRWDLKGHTKSDTQETLL